MSPKTHWLSLKDLNRIVKGAGEHEEYSCNVINYIEILELRNTIIEMYTKYQKRCGIPEEVEDEIEEELEDKLKEWLADLLKELLSFFGEPVVIAILAILASIFISKNIKNKQTDNFLYLKDGGILELIDNVKEIKEMLVNDRVHIDNKFQRLGYHIEIINNKLDRLIQKQEVE